MGILSMQATVLPGSGKTVASVRAPFDTDLMDLSTIASQPGNASFSQFNYKLQNGNVALARVKHTVASINAALPTAVGTAGFASLT